MDPMPSNLDQNIPSASIIYTDRIEQFPPHTNLNVFYPALSDVKDVNGLFCSHKILENNNLSYMVQHDSCPIHIPKLEFYPDDGQCHQSSVSLEPMAPLITEAIPQSLSMQCSENSTASINSCLHTEKDKENSESADQLSVKSYHLNVVKPSESLFVRAIIGRCKRIAPLWFKGVSSMRERNREENRRMATSNGQTQSDWCLIGSKIAEMNAATETETVSNLLKKLYKELPHESILLFLKCWLGSQDTVVDPHACVFSRGDAKGRMRRIDGGKGSDKVWRLDTIVGMLYHGLPMSSTDTNIMVHTCEQELCVRPQHIRFRASSVALVVVLKALAQAGYKVIPPSILTDPNGIPVNRGSIATDESVDVFGPFSIEKLQRYRSENLTPNEDSISKLALTTSDFEFAESLPVLRDALQTFPLQSPSNVIADSNNNNGNYATRAPVQTAGPPVNGCPPSGMLSCKQDDAYARSESIGKACILSHHLPPVNAELPVAARPHSPIRYISNTVAPIDLLSTTTSSTSCELPYDQRSTFVIAKQENNYDIPSTSSCPVSFPLSIPNFLPNNASSGLPMHKSERRSLKRPAPNDSPTPCSFPSSPSLRQSTNQPTTFPSPPLLIPDDATGAHPMSHLGHRFKSDSNIQPPVAFSTTSIQPCLPTMSTMKQQPLCVLQHPNVNDTLLVAPHGSFSSRVVDPKRPLFNSDLLCTSVDPAQLYVPVADTTTDIRTVGSAFSHAVGFSQQHHSSGDCAVQQPHPKSYQPHVMPLTAQVYCLSQPQQQQHFMNDSNADCNTTIDRHSPASFLPGSPLCIKPARTNNQNSGKNTPRQPAKKRLEARTPTIEGLDRDGDTINSAVSNVPCSIPIINLSDHHAPMDFGSSSGNGNLFGFQVHKNTPFVPVLGRCGGSGGDRCSSTGSGSSVTTTTNVSSSVGSNVAFSGHVKVITNDAHILGTPEFVSGSCGNPTGLPNSQLVTISTSTSSVASRLGAGSAQSDEDEAEMDQELADIMVRSDQRRRSSDVLPHNAATAVVADGDQVCFRNHNDLIKLCRRSLDKNASPSEEHFIAALVTALANTHRSPFTESSIPRRSASACSFPRLATSPSEDLAEFLLPNSSVIGSSNVTVTPHQSTTASTDRFIPSSHLQSILGIRSSGCNTLMNVGECSAVPPQLSPPKLSLFDHRSLMTTSRGAYNHSLSPSPSYSSRRPDSAVQQGLVNLIRQSPASRNLNQEMIELLMNMSQQYGAHTGRTGSRASRPSSEVAQRFYRSLVNGSMCSSPFAGFSAFGVCNTPIPSTCNITAPGTSGLDSDRPINDLVSPVSLPVGTNAYPQTSLNRLRELSFTPLTVDPLDSIMNDYRQQQPQQQQ